MSWTKPTVAYNAKIRNVSLEDCFQTAYAPPHQIYCRATDMIFGIGVLIGHPLTVFSLICNHEKQCEGHCVLGKKGAPVHFSTIEQYISRTYAPKMSKGPAKWNGMRVAIVGSGSAGITIAIILARYGYKVTIFENKSEIGGVLRYGIPDFRLPKTVLDDIQYRHIEMKGIKIRPNTHIGGSIGIDDLFRDGYRAIFVGTGVWKPNALHIKGETLGHVHFGINYLNSPESFHLGQRVIVIGAGNAAMDVARTAIRNGTEYLTCFSITKKVAASNYEYSYAKLEGVQFEYCKRPIEIVDNCTPKIMKENLKERNDHNYETRVFGNRCSRL